MCVGLAGSTLLFQHFGFEVMCNYPGEDIAAVVTHVNAGKLLILAMVSWPSNECKRIAAVYQELPPSAMLLGCPLPSQLVGSCLSMCTLIVSSIVCWLFCAAVSLWKATSVDIRNALRAKSGSGLVAVHWHLCLWRFCHGLAGFVPGWSSRRGAA